MKKNQFESLCRELAPHLPGFACKGWLLYSTPVGHLLRGFCCDTSGFDPAQFTVYVFVLPLYVPTNHLYFLFGNRLIDDRGCEKWWNVNDPSLVDDLLSRIKSQGIPFLSRIGSPPRLIESAQELPTAQEPRKWETIAYSGVMADDYPAAQQALDHLVKVLHDNIPWQAELLQRARELGQRLAADPQSAKQLLGEWEQATLRNLGLS